MGNGFFFPRNEEEIKVETEVKHMNYETIISLIELPADVELDAFKLACFNVSFTSRRKSDKFWLNLKLKKRALITVLYSIFSINSFFFCLTYLSRFFMDKFRSTFSIKLSNQWAIVCCLSIG